MFAQILGNRNYESHRVSILTLNVYFTCFASVKQLTIDYIYIVFILKNLNARCILTFANIALLLILNYKHFQAVVYKEFVESKEMASLRNSTAKIQIISSRQTCITSLCSDNLIVIYV